MVKRKHVVLPIWGSSGKYVVVNLRGGSSVLIAQSKKMFPTHGDIIDGFELAQNESVEAVLSKYDRYDETSIRIHELQVNRGEQPKYKLNLRNIRSRKDLVMALEEFSGMPKVAKKHGLEGGGRYRISKGVFTLYGTSDTYWPVGSSVLEKFRTPLREYFRRSGRPLDDIVIK